MEETIEKKVREALDSQAVIIPGFFDAEIIQKPDGVIIECFKIEEDSNGDC